MVLLSFEQILECQTTALTRENDALVQQRFSKLLVVNNCCERMYEKFATEKVLCKFTESKSGKKIKAFCVYLAVNVQQKSFVEHLKWVFVNFIIFPRMQKLLWLYGYENVTEGSGCLNWLNNLLRLLTEELKWYSTWKNTHLAKPTRLAWAVLVLSSVEFFPQINIYFLC